MKNCAFDDCQNITDGVQWCDDCDDKQAQAMRAAGYPDWTGTGPIPEIGWYNQQLKAEATPAPSGLTALEKNTIANVLLYHAFEIARRDPERGEYLKHLADKVMR